MDTAVLQLYVDVVRRGSFAAVARERNLDPSSVSRAVAGLETKLGVRLLQRTTRSLAPTEAGQLYYERVAPLVEDLQQAAQLAQDTAHQPQGTLRVSASVSFGQTCIVPLLPEFTAQYPNLTIELGLTDTVVDLLSEGVDVAIRLGLLADSRLVAQRLMPTTYRICGSPAYVHQWEHRYGPLERPSDLARVNCLRFPLPGFRSHWHFRDRQRQVTIVAVGGNMVIANAVALQHCARQGMGLALLPRWLIDGDLRTGTLVAVLADYAVTATEFDTAAWIVYPSRSYIPLKVQAFVAFLQQHCTPLVN